MSKPKLQGPPGFDEFWQVWRQVKRRTDGRLDAMDGFEKLIRRGADPQDIIDGARWFIRNLPAGYEFVPLAKTWLNRGGWMDDCEKERAFQARQSEPQKVVSIHAPKSRFLQRYEGRE